MKVITAYEKIDPWCRVVICEFEGQSAKKEFDEFEQQGNPYCDCDLKVIHVNGSKANVKVTMSMRSNCEYHCSLWDHYMELHPLPNRRLFPVEKTVMK